MHLAYIQARGSYQGAGPRGFSALPLIERARCFAFLQSSRAAQEAHNNLVFRPPSKKSHSGGEECCEFPRRMFTRGRCLTV